MDARMKANIIAALGVFLAALAFVALYHGTGGFQ